MKVKSESEVAQSYPTLSDPMGRSPPGSSVHGIFQARVLEWGATDTNPNTEVLFPASLSNVNFLSSLQLAHLNLNAASRENPP